MSEIKIFSGSSNKFLAKVIAFNLGLELGCVEHHTFPGGEKHVRYLENIRGADVFIIQSLNAPANDNIMELMVMIDAAKRASSGRVTVIMPYMGGYTRSDRKVQSRTPIGAKVLINMLESVGADKLVTMDLHSGQVQGFTDLSFDNLYAFPILVDYIKNKTDNLVIVSPDLGGMKRANAFAETLKCDFACVLKKRENDTQVSNRGIVGDVKGKNVLIVDDMSESMGTIIQASETCKDEGAIEIRAAVTHGLLNYVGWGRFMKDDSLTELIVTDTVIQPEIPEHIIGENAPFTVLGTGKLFANAIDCIHNNKSISELFQISGF